MIKVLPPKTAKEVVARERERKARTTLLMALTEDHLAKFHKMADAKEMWQAIKSRFGGNDESKKMQKYLLKQQFEGFYVSASEGLHKGYDSFDDLYNNLRVFKYEVKGTTASSSSNTQNVAFMSADNTSSTNDVRTAYSVSSPSVSKLHKEGSSSYTNEVAMVSMRIKKFRKRTGHFACRLKGFKTAEEEMVGTMETKLETMAEHLHIRMIQQIWLPLMERILTNLDIDYRYGSILSYENEVLQSVFMNKECDLEDTPVNDRYAERMHAFPHPITGNYMPSRPDVSSADESDSKPGEYASSKYDSSVETTTFMHAPKIVYEPKVWTGAPIIEECESDSDDDSVKNIKETNTPNHIPKIKKQDRYSHNRKGLGYTRKACFVCDSFSHLIRDCDFHEKRMAKQAALTKSKDKDYPHKALKDKGIVDSGCSRHMTGTKAHLADYQEFKGGSVAFGCSNRRITGKGKIKAGSFGVDVVEDFKQYTLRDYYCWLKTYSCWYKLKLLDNDADIKLRLLEESAATDDKMKK
nr:xylulose kinase-1 [Tanacetum cinerariifolium]